MLDEPLCRANIMCRSPVCNELMRTGVWDYEGIWCASVCTWKTQRQKSVESWMS